MAFTRPTLSELSTRIQLDFISRLQLTGAVLRRSMVYVIARVLAGVAHLLHGHLDFLSRQLFPDKAEAEFLERHATLFGLARIAPGPAVGTANFTGTNGSIIPGGTQLVAASGASYTTESSVTIAAGVASITVTAVTAGAAGTLVVGQALTLANPIAGVNSLVTVSAVATDGSDAETDDALRTRLLEHVRAPTHGGTAADYIAWAKEVPGVTRVWVTPFGLGAGTVLVRFARDNDVSPIPDAGEVAVVQAAIDAKRPIHAAVTVAAPVAAPVAITLSVVPDTTATRAAVSANLADLFQGTAPGQTILISAVRTAIGSADGVTDYTLTSPVANVTHLEHQLPTLGTITWV